MSRVRARQWWLGSNDYIAALTLDKRRKAEFITSPLLGIHAGCLRLCCSVQPFPRRRERRAECKQVHRARDGVIDHFIERGGFAVERRHWRKHDPAHLRYG